MPKITINVDEKLKDRMDAHPEINWSEVARTAYKERVEALETMDRLSSESALTDEDIEELSELIDSNVANRLTK